MNSTLVGVIGHVDHGKTELVKALTGVDTDRLQEEKRRGISIALGFSLLRTPSADIDLVDMPGHERFVRTMISGATGMNAVLLVVAADEGIKPQTLEHLDIAGLLGIRRGVLALSKCDLVSDARSAEVEADVLAQTAERGFEAMAVAHTSARTHQGIAELTTRLAALAEGQASRFDYGFFYMPIDRAFAVPGFGPVATGTLRRGPLSAGDAAEIMPFGLRAEIRSIQIHGGTLTAAEPGRRTAVALRGVEIGDVRPGLALATPGLLEVSNWIDIHLTLLPSAGALANGRTVRLLFGTSEVSARLRLLDRDELQPGEAAVAQLKCGEAIALPAGEPFILRSESPVRTIGGGRVLDPASRRRRRNDPAIVQSLQLMAHAAPSEIISMRLDQAGAAGRAIADLARSAGVSSDRARAVVRQQGTYVFGDIAAGKEALEALKSRICKSLAEFHRRHPMMQGMPMDQFRRIVADAAPDCSVDEIANRLSALGAISPFGGLIRLPDLDPAAALSAGDHELTRQVELVFRTAGLRPPDERQVVRDDDRRRQALRYLIRQGRLVRAVDRVQRRAIIFHAAAVEEASRVVAEKLNGPDGFLAGEAGAVLGISRKFSIPLLEHLDAVKATRRVGDRRFFRGSRQANAGPKRL